MIGICTDSNAQLPPSLVDRYGIEVVPLTVVVDGEAHLEGVDLDADAFYARFAGGAWPAVSTAAPSPGAFAAAYARLAERGAGEILSVHIGANVSATLAAARLAADDAPVPVRLVDTATASFAVGCAAWEAADAVERGATAAEAADVAARVAARCGNVFVVASLDLARRGGRLAAGVDTTGHEEGVPVLALVDGEIRPVAEAASVEGAAAAMAEHVRAGGRDALRVGVGHADAAAEPVADALEDLLVRRGSTQVVRYRVGPSVGAHTGPGTAGAVFYAVDAG